MTRQSPKKGLQLDPHQVVLAPLVTEKGTHLVERHNTYAFRVHMAAVKNEIKDAVERLFDVSVLDVRTQIRKGKRRRYRGKLGRTRDWKKAYVTLSEKDRIALF